MLPNLFLPLKDDTDVSAIVGNRIYRHGNAPQDVTKPYITWFLVTGVPDNNLSEPPPSDRMTCQVDCWHPTDLGIEQLAINVRNVLETLGHITSIVVNERDADTKLFRLAFQVDLIQNR